MATENTNESKKPILEVQNLTVRFALRDGDLTAVQDASFELFPGESLGVVGESGCGKSVTFLSVMRLIPMPPGIIEANRMRFDGFDVLSASNREMRRIRGNKISMVFQDPMTSLNPVLTIGKQMEESIQLHLGLSGRALHMRCVSLLDKVGISAPEMRLKAYPHQMSGGIRQRIMIAMALSCNPAVLLADEPTTALDVTIQDQILQLIRALTRDMGTATVLITHNLGAVAGTTDRIMVMYAGQIVEKATTPALFKDPRHPYTQGLLRSIPRVDRNSGKRLFSISGAPPDLLREKIRGCAFAPRCELADDVCIENRPSLERLSPEHDVSCWKAADAKQQ
ncbi:MAG: ABC transporter ATP-binding protein [Desulfobacteraceae bacterium]|nr:MAG: ABC transporter ATP-binding protein [Desulfobacteraceae bacterium]